jgi:hypothetical protein
MRLRRVLKHLSGIDQTREMITVICSVCVFSLKRGVGCSRPLRSYCMPEFTSIFRHGFNAAAGAAVVMHMSNFGASNGGTAINEAKCR